MVTVVIALQHRPMEFSLEAEEVDSHLTPTLQIRKLKLGKTLLVYLRSQSPKLLHCNPDLSYLHLTLLTTILVKVFVRGWEEVGISSNIYSFIILQLCNIHN